MRRNTWGVTIRLRLTTLSPNSLRVADTPGTIPLVAERGFWMLSSCSSNPGLAFSKHPYIRNHGSDTSANMFEEEKPAVSYV